MTFAEFFQEIYSSVFPDKDSPRLVKRHRNSVCDALTRVQRYAKCYRNRHRDIIRQDDTMFVGGVSVFTRPQGAPWEVRIERLDAQEDFVLAQPYTFAQMRALMETTGSCEYPVQCGPYGTDYGNYYYPGECAPEAACVPSNYAVAMDDDSMYLFPAVHICTRVVVSWNGVKRMWGDLDLIPWLDEDGYVDRDVMQAAEYFLHYESMLKDNCDPEKAASYLALHMQKIAELNSICARRNEVTGPPILFPWAKSSRGPCILAEANEETVAVRPEVATPTFSPPGGNYQAGPVVSILCATPDARIHFTVNGSPPNRESARYVAPLNISKSATLKAIGFKDGYRDGQIGTATYTVNLPQIETPVVTPENGTYTGLVLCTITCATPGVTIRFTRDGTQPNFASEIYSGPFQVTVTSAIVAVASKIGMTNSANGHSTYTIKTVAPLFTPPGGSYTAAQNAVISVPAGPAATGVSIFYNINSITDPTPASTPYTVPVSVPTTRLLKAIAAKAGCINSDVVPAAYVISPPVAEPEVFSFIDLSFVKLSLTQILPSVVHTHSAVTNFLLTFSVVDSNTGAGMGFPVGWVLQSSNNGTLWIDVPSSFIDLKDIGVSHSGRYEIAGTMTAARYFRMRYREDSGASQDVTTSMLVLTLS